MIFNFQSLLMVAMDLTCLDFFASITSANVVFFTSTASRAMRRERQVMCAI